MNFLMGTVTDYNLNSGGTRVKIDGEDIRTSKYYRRLNSYSSPTAGDRVLILVIAGTYLILGKVVK